MECKVGVVVVEREGSDERHGTIGMTGARGGGEGMDRGWER